MIEHSEYSNEVCRFVIWLLHHPGKTKSVIASNPCGVLWEQLWKFEAGDFWTITIAPGVYDVWKKVLPTDICKSISDALISSQDAPSLTMLQQDRPKMIRPDSAYIVTDIVPDKSPPK